MPPSAAAARTPDTESPFIKDESVSPLAFTSATPEQPIAAELEFSLDGRPNDERPAFDLESDSADTDSAEQVELHLVSPTPADIENNPQIELAGMEKPTFTLQVQSPLWGDIPKALRFQNARTLLEALEAQHMPVQYQCRSGYCGACRCKKTSGDVAYIQEPMAWINDDEILPCVAVPKSDLQLQFDV